MVSSGALGWRSNDWRRDPVRSLHWAREAREFRDEEERRYYRTPRMVSRSCVLCVCVCVCVCKPPCLYSPLCHVRAGTRFTDEMGTEVEELQGWSGPGIHATHFLACLYLVLCFSTTITYSTSPLKSDLRKTQSLI